MQKKDPRLMVQNNPKWRDVKHKGRASKTFGWIGRHDPTYGGPLQSRDSRENLLFLRRTNVQLSIFVVVLYKNIRSVSWILCSEMVQEILSHTNDTSKGRFGFVNRISNCWQNVVSIFDATKIFSFIIFRVSYSLLKSKGIENR